MRAVLPPTKKAAGNVLYVALGGGDKTGNILKLKAKESKKEGRNRVQGRESPAEGRKVKHSADPYLRNSSEGL